MKRNYLNNIIFIITAAMLWWSCRQPKAPDHSLHETGATDSSVIAAAGPVNEQIFANVSVITPTSGMRIFSTELHGSINYDSRKRRSIASRVAGRIERLMIRYNYQAVKKGELIMEIYSPDLAAAQRELLYLSKSADAQMTNRAVQRLQLLGMRREEVDNVLRTGNILYRVPVYSNTDGYVVEKNESLPAPAINTGTAETGSGMNGMSGSSSSATSSSSSSGSTTATTSAPAQVQVREGQYVGAGQNLFDVYKADELVAEFAITPSLARSIKPQQKIVLYPQYDKQEVITASIGLLEPVYRNGQSYGLARVYLENREYQVGTLVSARIPIVVSGGWWLPSKSLWKLGNKAVVFIKTGTGFQPAEVEIRHEIGGMTNVSTNISDWQVAENAAYLVDSESFIHLKTENQE